MVWLTKQGHERQRTLLVWLTKCNDEGQGTLVVLPTNDEEGQGTLVVLLTTNDDAGQGTMVVLLTMTDDEGQGTLTFPESCAGICWHVRGCGQRPPGPACAAAPVPSLTLQSACMPNTTLCQKKINLRMSVRTR